MKGRIEKLETKQARNGRRYLLVTIDSQNYSLWDVKAFDRIHEGDLVEYQSRRAGDYLNITEIEPLDEMPGDPPSARDQHILRMSCLKSASAILANLDEPADKRVKLTIDAARRFEKYVTGDDDGE